MVSMEVIHTAGELPGDFFFFLNKIRIVLSTFDEKKKKVSFCADVDEIKCVCVCVY
jgi:hypothetical protein